MKATDLKLGNWFRVLHEDDFETFHRVDIDFLKDQLDYDLNPDDDKFARGWNPQPIPLTPEILEMAGFVFCPTGDEVYEQIWSIGAFEIWEHDEGFCHDYHIGGAVDYLHQLQNLYHALTCGEELNIEL